MAGYRSVSEFDDEELALERKRKIIASLMAQDAPARTPQGRFYTPDYGALHKAIGDIGGVYDLEHLNEQSRNLASKRADFARQALAEYPEPRPAVPEIEGTGPIAPPPGTPGVDDAPPPAPAGEADVMPMPSANNMMPDTPAIWDDPKGMSMIPQGAEFTPNQAAQPAFLPDPDTFAKWGLKYAGLSPHHAKMAETGFTKARDLEVKKELAREAVIAKKEAAAEAAANRLHEREIAFQNNSALMEKAGIDKRLLEDWKKANGERLEDARISLMKAQEELARARADQAGSGEAKTGTVVREGTTPKGDIIYRDNKDKDARKFTTINGVKEYYNGPVLEAAEGKQVVKALDSLGSIAASEKLLERVLKPENAIAFTGKANIGGIASDKTEGFIRPNILEKGMKAEHYDLRASVYRDFAKLMHELYGAALTATEKETARSFTVARGMGPELIASRIRSQIEFEKQMLAQYGNKVRGAAEERAGKPSKTVDVEY